MVAQGPAAVEEVVELVVVLGVVEAGKEVNLPRM